MLAIDEQEFRQSSLRIEALEQRVAQLEAALTRVLGASPLAPTDTQFAKTQKLAALPAANVPALAAAMPPAAAADDASGADGLGITAAFAVLDLRVAEAAEAETRFRQPPDLSQVVPIDPGLIEDRFEIKPLPAARRTPVRMAARCALEDGHPKIMKRLELTWRTPECLAYLNRLIVTDRNDRAGFDHAVMSELLLLTEMLETVAGQDAWAANAQAY